LLICDVWTPTSIVFLFLLSCFMLSTELMSCYLLHVPCIVLVLAMLCTLNIIMITWGWGRLDGWLDLIGWMNWIHIYPIAGDGSAAYWLYIAPWAPVSRFQLPSERRALVSAARGLFKALICYIYFKNNQLVDRLRDPNSRLGSVDRHFWFSLLNGRAVDRPVDQSQWLFYRWAVGRPVGWTDSLPDGYNG